MVELSLKNERYRRSETLSGSGKQECIYPLFSRRTKKSAVTLIDTAFQPTQFWAGLAGGAAQSGAVPSGGLFVTGTVTVPVTVSVTVTACFACFGCFKQALLVFACFGCFSAVPSFPFAAFRLPFGAPLFLDCFPLFIAAGSWTDPLFAYSYNRTTNEPRTENEQRKRTWSEIRAQSIIIFASLPCWVAIWHPLASLLRDTK